MIGLRLSWRNVFSPLARECKVPSGSADEVLMNMWARGRRIAFSLVVAVGGCAWFVAPVEAAPQQLSAAVVATSLGDVAATLFGVDRWVTVAPFAQKLAWTAPQLPAGHNPELVARSTAQAVTQPFPRDSAPLLAAPLPVTPVASPQVVAQRVNPIPTAGVKLHHRAAHASSFGTSEQFLAAFRAASRSSTNLSTAPASLAASQNATLSVGNQPLGNGLAASPGAIVLPVFRHDVTVQVGADAGSAATTDTATLPYYPTSNTSSYSYSATAAVPVTSSLHVGLGYTTSRLLPTTSSDAGEPLADHKAAYSGALTYAPHNGNKSVTIMGRQYRYSADAAPNAPVKQTRGDILFSVKF